MREKINKINEKFRMFDSQCFLLLVASKLGLRNSEGASNGCTLLLRCHVCKKSETWRPSLLDGYRCSLLSKTVEWRRYFAQYVENPPNIPIALFRVRINLVQSDVYATNVARLVPGSNGHNGITK
jgi:hypothetical protein